MYGAMPMTPRLYRANGTEPLPIAWKRPEVLWEWSNANKALRLISVMGTWSSARQTTRQSAVTASRRQSSNRHEIATLGTSLETRKAPGKPRGLVGLVLDVRVEHELPRVRPKGDLVDFLLPLVFDPGVDHILGEHATLDEDGVVLLQRVDRFGERARH